MEAINRSAIVVKPAQPFLDWLHRVHPTSAQLTLDDLSLEPTIYLLPECEGKEEAIGCLREVCTEIFEEQLDGWYRVPSKWPAERDLHAFLIWFEWSLHSMIIDLGDDPIEHEVSDPGPTDCPQRTGPIFGRYAACDYVTAGGLTPNNQRRSIFC